MKLLIFGDISTWNITDFSIDKINPEIVKKIKISDYVIYNLEGPIRKQDKKYKLQLRTNPFKQFIFKFLLKITKKEQPIVYSDEKIIDLFKLNKNTIITLANNHIKDLGFEGFKDTINILKRHNIKYLGVGVNNKDASQDLLVNKHVIINTNHVACEKKGIKFKIYNATKTDYGGSYQNYDELKEKILEYHKEHKKVILIIHGGKEMPKENKQIGIDLEKVKSLKADCSIIHHFHKYIKTKYEQDRIFCLGDFIFHRPNKLPQKRESSFLSMNSTLLLKLNKCKLDEVYNNE